jgi:adenosylhomocysteine nucleosidase
MKIGIITAMPEEYRAVVQALGVTSYIKPGALRGRIFSCYGHEFLLVESGIGFDNAARAVEAIIEDLRPDLLITTGFCGGIAPELQAGDVVVAKNIVIANGATFEEVPVCLSATGQNFVARQALEGKRVFGGTFISSAVITSKKQLAGMLSTQYTNQVVEMESAAVAIIAAEKKVPLLAIRAVSDDAAEELKFSIDEFCDSDMRRIRLHKVLQTILCKPHITPQLIRLAFSSRTAAKSLTAALSRMFPSL